MQWYNEPAAWHEDNGQIRVSVGGQTDYWRVTRHDFIKDDAPFYYREVSGDFTATVKITGDYAALYDQAGLMVRANANVWLKCGIEFLDGVQQASAVVTRDFSDWSVVALPDNPRAIWFRVQRIGTALEVYYSRDGAPYTLIRQAYFSDAAALQVGVMGAAPVGDGFDVVFENLTIA
jgi:regulation of enolase protein 1 (concanavalin A-like superfamily)